MTSETRTGLLSRFSNFQILLFSVVAKDAAQQTLASKATDACHESHSTCYEYESQPCTMAASKRYSSTVAFLGAFMLLAVSVVGLVVNDDVETTSPHGRRTRQVCNVIPESNLLQTWEWARDRKEGASTGMMVIQNEEIIFEEYDVTNICELCNFFLIRWIKSLTTTVGGSRTQIFDMYSMTKSFSGLAALLLLKDGFIPSLDVPVSTYVTEWSSDAQKKDITIRELLSLSSGIQATVLPIVTLKEALDVPVSEPGWSYGSQPFTVFSYLLQIVTGQTAEDYLKNRLFNPLGMEVDLNLSADWSNPVTQLNSGGKANFADMAKLGQELINAAKNGQGQIFSSSDIDYLLTTAGINIVYGLTFWLNAAGGLNAKGQPFPHTVPQCGTRDVFHILGPNGAALTLVPTLNLVVLRSVRISKTRDTQQQQRFRDLLFEDVPCQCQ